MTDFCRADVVCEGKRIGEISEFATYSLPEDPCVTAINSKEAELRLDKKALDKLCASVNSTGLVLRRAKTFGSVYQK